MHNHSITLQSLSLNGSTGASGPNVQPLVDLVWNSELGLAVSRFPGVTRRAQGMQQRPKVARCPIVQVGLHKKNRGRGENDCISVVTNFLIQFFFRGRTWMAGMVGMVPMFSVLRSRI